IGRGKAWRRGDRQQQHDQTGKLGGHSHSYQKKDPVIFSDPLAPVVDARSSTPDHPVVPASQRAARSTGERFMATTAPTSVRELKTQYGNGRKIVESALEESGGLLRLAPCWVPRSFLQPGKRLKLDPKDLYAFGLNRGGIDERWFGSTTPAANENRTPDEDLSYVVARGHRFTLADAVATCGADLIGQAIWDRYGKWPVYSKFFDNMGPIP